ncbi:PorT family protein, partial [Fulvivirga sp. RKSG066]|uniref:outer membrane beta-barrel protein n=1 Tax=Fulvivirga aurantia TaxID=2529383 RepID=UPI0012BC4961
MNKCILALVAGLTLFCSQSMAQKKKKRKTYPVYAVQPRPSENDRFLQTQWWLGFKAGANTTTASPETRYSGFSPVNYEPTSNQKQYEDFGALAGHAGLEITLYHRGFSFSLQPNYRRQNFIYTNSYEWAESENANNTLVLNYKQSHLLDYIEIPFFIKYDLTQTKLRPFVQVGAYYARLVGAQKSVEITGVDMASGNSSDFETQNLIIGAEDVFIKSSTGIAGGVGVSYDVWNVRFVFDATYRYGLNTIADAKNRYATNQLASIGDAMDDVELRNISISLGC